VPPPGIHGVQRFLSTVWKYYGAGTGIDYVLFPTFSFCSSNEKNGNIIKVKDC
jgi:hypothetical protein